MASDDQALIAHQQLQIEKLRRELYGPRSERTSRLIDQIELAVRGAGELGHRGRDRRREGGGQDHDGCGILPQAPSTQALPRASAARTRDRAGAGSLPLLWQRTAAQAGRDGHRDAGIDPAAMEGDPACAREVHVPGLREDQRGAGAVPCDRREAGRVPIFSR